MNDNNNLESIISTISKKQGNRIKQKGIWFNGATHSLNDIENIQNFIGEFPFYAFIHHDKDDDNTNLHLHFLLNTRGRVSIKNVAEKLGCDYGVVQITDRPRSYARYMLHLGTDKKQYSVTDVNSNDLDRFKSFITDVTISTSQLFDDFYSLKAGRISREEFVIKYNGELSRLNFYQKIRVFSELDKITKF